MTYSNITSEELDNLVVEHLPLVKLIANNLIRKLSMNVQLDDMVQAGSMGLLQAIKKFNGSSGVPFANYARFRIKGSMLDELGAADYIGETERKRINNIKRKRIELENNRGRSVSNGEIATALNISIGELNKTTHFDAMFSVTSIDYCNDDDDDDCKYEHLQTKINSAEEDYINQEEQRVLWNCIERLSKQQQEVLHFHYNKGLTFVKIGKILNISSSRADQERKAAERNIIKMMNLLNNPCILGN